MKAGNKAPKPLVAITMGDAAGIGPEIIAKALRSRLIYRLCRPVVIGDPATLQQNLALINSSAVLHEIRKPAESLDRPGTIDVLSPAALDQREVKVGQVCAACGKAAVQYLLEGARLAAGGEIDALVTAPLNKEATRLAGYGELGHLEFLARFTQVADCATMLCSGPLRVVHLTTHYSLKDALAAITADRILAKLKLTQVCFRGWGQSQPVIAVAALNPHGGEGGILGDEEAREIVPATESARKAGIDCRGPFPADSIFLRAIAGEFDAVLALYHDQGHIPIKIYGFEKSVSVALGLPFIRTSVDHGTAFDIAGRGMAQSASLLEAIKMAVRLSLGQGLAD
jgi:4-hydroxythreonine-4-phosphate dehydrogenase